MASMISAIPLNIRGTVRVIRPTLRAVALFLRREAGRRRFEEPPTLRQARDAVRFEAWHGDYETAIRGLIIDVVWNLAFVSTAIAGLVVSWDEAPRIPLRAWVVGFVMKYLLHVVAVYVAYWPRVKEAWVSRRRSRVDVDLEAGGSSSGTDDIYLSVAKYLESANVIFSVVWWIMGFYWVSTGAQTLIQDTPQLFCLTVFFLAFDLIFIAFWVVFALIVGAAICCCLPCIVGILYAVPDQEGGASDEDIRRLRRYTFRRTEGSERVASDESEPCSGVVTQGGRDSSADVVFLSENTECCICVSPYEDGEELCELPCCHRFHYNCIKKWLRINAICPLCKYNIITGNNNVM